jgi:hypothetical protein
VPTVAVVDGIKIMFYNDEHSPPHFHVRFAEHDATIDIGTLEIVSGHIPRVQYRKVVAWAASRRAALSLAWEVCAQDRNPGKIA